MAYGELEQEALDSRMTDLSPEAAVILLEELQRIDRLELEYRAAWDRSKVIQDDACGDPRFLQGIERCIRQRCELLGLYSEGDRVRRTTARPSVTTARPSWLSIYEASTEQPEQQGDDDDGE